MSSLTDRTRVRRAGPFLYLFAIGIALSAVHVAGYRQLSPIDELRHVDYAMSVTHLQFVHLGDRIGQEAMRAEACRGVDLPTWLDPPCRSARFNPRAFRDDGYQTASAHPPTYYLTVGLVSRAAVGLGLFDNFVDPARLMGGVLLGAGLVLTYLAGRRLGLRSGALLAALTLVPTSSAVLHASSTVNPDATAVLAGGLVLFAAVAWEQRRLGTLALVVAGAVATGLKLTNLLVVAAVAAWLVVRSETLGVVIGRARAGWRRANLGGTTPPSIRARHRLCRLGPQIIGMMARAQPSLSWRVPSPRGEGGCSSIVCGRRSTLRSSRRIACPWPTGSRRCR